MQTCVASRADFRCRERCRCSLKLKLISSTVTDLERETNLDGCPDPNLFFEKVDIVDTKNTLAADEQFLAMLKEKCAMTDKEWEELGLMSHHPPTSSITSAQHQAVNAEMPK